MEGDILNELQELAGVPPPPLPGSLAKPALYFLRACVAAIGKGGIESVPMLLGSFWHPYYLRYVARADADADIPAGDIDAKLFVPAGAASAAAAALFGSIRDAAVCRYELLGPDAGPLAPFAESAIDPAAGGPPGNHQGDVYGRNTDNQIVTKVRYTTKRIGSEAQGGAPQLMHAFCLYTAGAAAGQIRRLIDLQICEVDKREFANNAIPPRIFLRGDDAPFRWEPAPFAPGFIIPDGWTHRFLWRRAFENCARRLGDALENAAAGCVDVKDCPCMPSIRGDAGKLLRLAAKLGKDELAPLFSIQETLLRCKAISAEARAAAAQAAQAAAQAAQAAAQAA
ncbi:MAG: hypothetical protein EBU46_14580, partial [Nitrosomonadaceae bacterium]|nr:hypothetical protein [Nitrosomonadaceae bacterium]